MKTPSYKAIPIAIALNTMALCATAASTDPVIGERGPHHRAWQRISQYTTRSGQTAYRTNTAYIELATGLHYPDEITGQWRDSEEIIELVDDGAVARKTAHKVKFLSNVNAVGALDVLTPDGKRLRSRILGLVYSDAVSGKSVLFAQTKDCIGEVALPNQVIYQDAFNGVLAMARYTLTKAGIEQDIVFLENPPSPLDFGLDPATTRLEVWTEFFDPPVPQLTVKVLAAEQDPVKRQAMAEPDFIDAYVDFGEMKIGRGRAFFADEKQTQGKRTDHVPVGKIWVQVEGGNFLIEKVPYLQIKEALDFLPKSAAVSKGKKESLLSFKQKNGKIKDFALAAKPGDRISQSVSKATMRLARVPTSRQGFVLDYIFSLTDTNDFVLKGDTTYFVSGQVNLSGLTSIEGGTVIKFTNAASLTILSNVICLTDSSRPSVFSSMHDNTVGYCINGSTGNPYVNSYNCALDIEYDDQSLHDLRIAYASYGLYYPGASNLTLRNIQLLRNYYGVYFDNEGINLIVDNCLWYSNYYHVFGSQFTLYGQNLTVRQGNAFTATTTNSIIDLTNCLIAGVTYMGVASLRTTNCTAILSSDTGVFQEVGAGYCYLCTNSPYRDSGTTNLTPEILTELSKRTTYPPIVLNTNFITADTVLSPQAQRDTGQPDLGYHYAPLDYALTVQYVSNSVVTLTNGVAVAYYGIGGIYLMDNSELISSGSPITRNIYCTYNGTVAE